MLTTHVEPVPIDSIDIGQEFRFATDIKEFDRVLGGGLVTGSLVLIGGDPGIGKSTLMLQALYGLAKNKRKVLYVSGEESIQQIRLRSKRLGVVSSNLFVVSEIDIDAILAMIKSEKPCWYCRYGAITAFHTSLSRLACTINSINIGSCPLAAWNITPSVLPISRIA